MYDRSGFTASDHCESRVHCQACRAATPAGERWRASAAKAFPATEGGADFLCPDGLSIGADVPARQPTIATPPKKPGGCNC